MVETKAKIAQRLQQVHLLGKRCASCIRFQFDSRILLLLEEQNDFVDAVQSQLQFAVWRIDLRPEPQLVLG